MRIVVFAFIAVIALCSFSYSNIEKEESFDSKSVNFRIQLCEYDEIVPIKEVQLLRQIGATPFKTKTGSIYVTKPYATEKDAGNDLPKFLALGFINAQQMVQLGDQLLTINNYHDLNNSKGDADKGEKPGAIRIWK